MKRKTFIIGTVLAFVGWAGIMFMVMPRRPVYPPGDRDDWLDLTNLRWIQCCDCGLVHELFYCEKDGTPYIAFDRDEARTEKARIETATVDANMLLPLIEAGIDSLSMSSRLIYSITKRLTKLEYERLSHIESFVQIMLARNLQVGDEKRDWTVEERLEVARQLMSWSYKHADPNEWFRFDPNTNICIEFYEPPPLTFGDANDYSFVYHPNELKIDLEKPE